MKILEILLLFSIEAQNVRERWKEILWRMNENLNETYEIDARRKGKKGQWKSSNSTVKNKITSIKINFTYKNSKLGEILLIWLSER